MIGEIVSACKAKVNRQYIRKMSVLGLDTGWTSHTNTHSMERVQAVLVAFILLSD